MIAVRLAERVRRHAGHPHVDEEARPRRPEAPQAAERLPRRRLLPEQALQRVHEIRIRDDHVGADPRERSRARRAGLHLDPTRPAAVHEDARDERVHQDVATLLFESRGERVGERLRPSLGIVVAEKVREPQHRVEHERDARRRRSPVPAVRRQQQLQFRMPDVPIDRIAQREAAERVETIGVMAAKEIQQPAEIRSSRQLEKPIQPIALIRKLLAQRREVPVEVRGDAEARAVGKVKAIDRIHLDPADRHPEIRQKSPRDGRWIPEERIEMRRGVERVPLPPERAAVAADHVVLLDDEDAQPGAGEEVGANEAADAGAGDDGVVRLRRSASLEAAERPRHRSAPSAAAGRLRPYFSWAATNSPLAIAAAIEISPARSVAATISANLRAHPAPAHPSTSRHSRLVPSAVPPPTVATVSDGSVTLTWTSPPSSGS